MDQHRMRAVPVRATGSRRASRTEDSGRPMVFGSIVMLALACLLTVLLGGPTMPLAASVVMAAISVLLVITGWIIAGPRGR